MEQNKDDVDSLETLEEKDTAVTETPDPQTNPTENDKQKEKKK